METRDFKPDSSGRSKPVPMSSSAETEKAQPAKALIQAYFQEHLEVYRELRELRDVGHKSEDADVYFQNQRSRVDYADEATQKRFFQLMVLIGRELDVATSGALKIRHFGMPHPSILDLCMAPGGFSYVAQELSHRPITIRDKEDIHTATRYVDYRDITLLSGEMGVELGDIPPSHPDAALFSSDRPYLGSQFDLVFCDGQLLRIQERGEHRQNHETVRLLTSQLVLALQRIRSGGNMIILLHRADLWDSVRLIYTFSLFSDKIQLFKPTKGHRLRGSFYLVAQGIRPEREAALLAVQGWTAQWKFATFGREAMGEGELGLLERAEEIDAQFVIDQFGSELLSLVEPVFRVQMEALGHAPWMKKSVVKSVDKEAPDGEEETIGPETIS